MTYKFKENGELDELTAAELVAEDAYSAITVLDRGVTADGTPYWLYIDVKPSKFQDFVRAVRSGTPKVFEDYGTILKFGYDKEVPESVKEEMKQQYGFDENCIENLKKDIRAEQKKFLEKKEDNRIGDIVAMLKKKQQN